MTQISRRKFLRLASLMGGASLFAGCDLFHSAGPVPQYIEGAPGVDPVETIEGIKNVYSVCGLCPGNCGTRGRVAGFTLVKIDGSPFNPISAHGDPISFDSPLAKADPVGASICAIGGSGIQSLYDPFRVAKPLKRVGPRGSGKWKALTWKQAFTEIIEGGDLFGEGRIAGLRTIKESGDGLGFLAGRMDWGARVFLERFAGSIPGAKIYRDGSVSIGEVAREAADAVFGPGTGQVGADYRNANVLLSFGDAPLDSGIPLVSIARDIADRRVAPGSFQWTVVDPRLSTSASKADLWVPVIPGKDLQLALGIMRVMAESYSDRIPFPDEGLKQTVMACEAAGYAAACGIDEALLNKIAQMLVKAGPKAAVIPGNGIFGGPEGLETAKAILTLNRMVGSVPGSGGLFRRSDDFLIRTEKKLLPDVDLNRRSTEYGPEVKALVSWRSDPVYYEPETASAFLQDKSKTPLFVAMDYEITESSALADYILPDTTYLERWDICASPPGVADQGIGVRAPVVGHQDTVSGQYRPIVPESRLMEDILIGMGAVLDLPGFKPVSGKPPATAKKFFDETISVVLDSMKAEGFPISGSKKDVARVIARGGCFSTPKKGLTEQASYSVGKYVPPVIPAHSTKTDTADTGFLLLTYTLPFHRAPSSGLNSWLLEVLPENRVMINNSDARKLNLHQGDNVVIEAAEGTTKLECRAMIAPGIRPGVIALANGFGYKQAGAAPFTVDNVSSGEDLTRAAGVNPSELRGQRVRVKKT
jgi:anaerobic selenocysteine-containing dehydrogenase